MGNSANASDNQATHAPGPAPTLHSQRSKSKSFSRSKSKTKTHGATSLSILPSFHSSKSAKSVTASSRARLSRRLSPSAQAWSMLEFTAIDNLNNGITGKYISPRVVKIAAQFWYEHVTCKPRNERMELSCAVYFGMMVHGKEMKKLLASKFSTKNIESSAYKVLGMMEWLLITLLRPDSNVKDMLMEMGANHRAMGIELQHFDPMLQSMHESFSYYYPIKYGIQIKYAMDQVFALAARIMTGHDLATEREWHLSALQTMKDNVEGLAFLQSVEACLSSDIGREYLNRYLQQTFCDEIAIFLQSVATFKTAASDKERFMLARSICKGSIETAAMFCVNISYENRENAISRMAHLEQMFFEKDTLVVPKDMFSEVETEMLKLVVDNHWTEFTRTFKNMNKEGPL